MARTDTVFLPRVGRWPWIWGKILFVAEYVAMMLCAYYLLIILFCMPYIDFTRWSWSPFAMQQCYYAGGRVTTFINPILAMFYTIGLTYLFLFLMTMLIVLLNLYFSRVIGLLAVGTVCLFSETIDWMLPKLARLGLTLHALLPYHQFGGMDNIPAGPGTRLPTLGESYIVFIVLCALLLGLILWRVKRYDFQTYEKGMH